MFTLTLLDVTLNCSIKLLSCYAVIFLSILSHSFCCHTLFAVVSFCGLHVFLWQHGVPVIQLENPRVINSTSPHNHKHQHQCQEKYQHQDIHQHHHQHQVIPILCVIFLSHQLKPLVSNTIRLKNVVGPTHGKDCNKIEWNS